MWTRAHGHLRLKYQRVAREARCTTPPTLRSVIPSSPREPGGDKLREGSESGGQSSNCKSGSGSFRILFQMKNSGVLLKRSVHIRYTHMFNIHSDHKAFSLLVISGNQILIHVSVRWFHLRLPEPRPTKTLATFPRMHTHTLPTVGMEKSMLYQPMNAKAL